MVVVNIVEPFVDVRALFLDVLHQSMLQLADRVLDVLLDDIAVVHHLDLHFGLHDAGVVLVAQFVHSLVLLLFYPLGLLAD